MNFLGLTVKAIAATLDGIREGNHMAKKEILDKLSIYIPQKKMEEKPVERLIRLGNKKDRSINYLVVEAILEYLKREEKRYGSTSQVVQKHISAEVVLAAHSQELGKSDDKAIAYRESPRQGRASAADKNEDGSFSYKITGHSPQGEDDTLSACRVLMDKLNKEGSKWGQPRKGDGVVDCRAIDELHPEKELTIQVVRAVVDQCLWRQLSAVGEIRETAITKEELVEQLKRAIEFKANEQKIPKMSRPSLMLALDANRLPAYAFDDVVEEFRLQWGSWAKTLGFDSIWLVGPTVSLTWQLDVSP